MIYKSSRLLEKQILEIRNSSVYVSRKGLFDSIEYEIPFENIGTSRIIGTYASNSAFISSFFCLIVTILMLLFDSVNGFLIFAFITLVAFAFGVITRTRMVTIPSYSGENINLYFKRNSREAAIEFADVLIVRIKAYLKNKYTKFDRQMPLEKQFDDLYFLKERDLITEAEYEEFKSYLLSSEKRSIGFGK